MYKWWTSPDLLAITCIMGIRTQAGPLLPLLQTGPGVLYHPAQLRKNHPVPGNWTPFTSWMWSGGWGASSRWVIWLKRWLSVVLASHSTANSHFIWSPLCCSNHIFPGPAASQEMETKQQMIHISSKEAKKAAKKKLSVAETATNLWVPGLSCYLMSMADGISSPGLRHCPLSPFSPKRKREERREEQEKGKERRGKFTFIKYSLWVSVWLHKPISLM